MGGHKPSPDKAPMVGWFDPGQLARTGIQIVVSSLFGARADFRALEAINDEAFVFDCKGPGDDAWVEYVADTGDGFAPTYAVASLVARPSIDIGDIGGQELPRGGVLIMGGDEVYPTPTPEGYEARLVGPYASALPYDRAMTDDQRPKLFAIPGNHDWYDGLGCFMNLFGGGRHIGNWHTPQKRSYFVVELPHRTWLVAVDIQLSSDIDHAQLEALSNLEGMKPGDRVILCTAEPDWQYRAPAVNGEDAAPKNLDRLRRRYHEHGLSIVLQLAGDQHHYRRQSDAAGETHLVTAGGGGAFLHPTHTNIPDDVELLGRTYACLGDKDYPPRKRSRAISWNNWLFTIKNPWFGVTTAAVYVILGLVMPPPHAPKGPWYLQGTVLVVDGLSALAESPSTMAWVLLVIAGFFAFTDTHKRWYRYVAGFGHGAAHLANALAGGLAAVRARDWVHDAVAHAFGGFGLTHLWATGKAAMLASFFAYIAALGVWGYVFGSLLFGAYLWISVLVFGRHGNEAFSAVKHTGYRNFLRLRIAKDVIEVFALGLDRVPGAREYAWDDGEHKLPPGVTLTPRVIDRFEARVPR